MEPIAGHRRRKSSLMNPVGAQAGGSAHGHRSHPSISIPQESKIFEDGAPPRTGESSKDDPGNDSSSDEDLHDDEEMGLTSKDRSRKQKKRRRNTRLDNRVAREKISADEAREADKLVVKDVAVILLFILLWYILSLSISLVSLPLPALSVSTAGWPTLTCPQ